MATLKSLKEKQTILVVDDTPDNLSLMGRLLAKRYDVRLVNSGERALKIAFSDEIPDLILLDIMMPEMDGYEVCGFIKSRPSTRDIPIVFLTAKDTREDEARGLGMGAVDYITKPISPPIVLARIETHLKLKRAQTLLQDQNDYLEAVVRERTHEIETRRREIEIIQDVTVQALASLAETRDSETGNHIRRTQHYVRCLAENLRFHPRFSHVLDDDKTIDLLFKSAPLHDIGKVGIPDAILLKPAALTEREFEIMKQHPRLGLEALIQAERQLGIEIPFLLYAKDIVYRHHERWNGTGYPDGLSGDAIPIAARLMALADVYDALISQRVYKAGMPHAQAAEIIRSETGTHFDPDVVKAFLAVQAEFSAIAHRFADSEEDLLKKRHLVWNDLNNFQC